MTPLVSSTGKRNQGVAVSTRARRQCSRVLPESVGMADRAGGRQLVECQGTIERPQLPTGDSGNSGDKQAYASEA